MKLSNRFLGSLLLLSIIGAFYIFYQVFFKIKLVNLEITSNKENFSWTLENIKFSKDFFCETRKCVISEIPPFDYKLRISKDNYKNISKNINLKEKQSINIFLKKDINIKRIEQKELNKREQIIEKIKNKINFSWDYIKYNKIYWEDNLVYFIKNNKLYFYNLLNKNSFSIILKPRINYIKKLTQNTLLINTEVWSFTFNILNRQLDYFSLFSNFIIYNESYIGVINSSDLIRRQNFDLENIKWNLLVSYNIKTKKKYILKNINLEIKKIFFIKEKLFIENSLWEVFEIKNF